MMKVEITNKEYKKFSYYILERDEEIFKALTNNNIEFKALNNDCKLPDKVIGYVVEK